MNFSEYNKISSETLFYPQKPNGELSIAPMYLALGVTGEGGELGEKIKKVYRDYGGIFTQESILEIKKEVGDVLWYLNRLSEELGFTLESAAELNVTKIQDRIKREVLRGQGDNR